MTLKDESVLAIGMISIALGILIGGFVKIKYSGLRFRFRGRSSCWAVLGDEPHLSDATKIPKNDRYMNSCTHAQFSAFCNFKDI
jgi:hypothetical protein